MSEKLVEAGGSMGSLCQGSGGRWWWLGPGWEERHPSALLKLDREDGVGRISLKEWEGIESLVCNEGH